MPPTNAPKKAAPVAPVKAAKASGKSATAIPKSDAPKKTKAPKAAKTEEDDFEEWKKSKALVKPKDQLELSDAVLKEEHCRVLQTINLQIPDSLVEYSFHENTFVPTFTPANYIIVYSQKGTYIHKDSEEARKQIAGLDIEVVTEEAPVAAPSASNVTEPTEEKSEEGEREGGEEGGETKGEAEAEEVPRPAGGKKLPNQFNFCERDALTYNNPVRSQGTQTYPPSIGSHSENVQAYIIYDDYQRDYDEQQAELQKERERREREMMSISKTKPPPKKVITKAQLNEILQARMYECWKTLERMINQNTYVDIAKDYRYWDDPADEYLEDEGTLLPLWKFVYDKTKKNTVTDMCWNPYYYDLFAVCFGHCKSIMEEAYCNYIYTIS